MKKLKEEIVDKVEILNNVNETEKNDRTMKYLKKYYPEEIKKREEVLLNYMGENDIQIFETEVRENKWKYLPKNLAYPYEYFNSIDGYQKPVDNLKKEDFFSKLKNFYPSYKEKERTEKIINFFNNKNGEKPTHLYLKSDVHYLHVFLRVL